MNPSTAAGKVAIKYDGEGRIAATSGMQTTERFGRAYICAGGKCVKRVFAGSEEVAQIDSAVTTRLTDQIGSTVATSSSGGKTEVYSYSAFGRSEATGPQPTAPATAFAGQLLEPGTGLYFMGTRWYHPLLGTFLSSDDTEIPSHNPQAFNRFAYAANRPTVTVDPTGRDDEGGEPGGGEGDEGNAGNAGNEGNEGNQDNQGASDAGPANDVGAGSAVNEAGPGDSVTIDPDGTIHGTSTFSLSDRSQDQSSDDDDGSRSTEPTGPGNAPSAPGMPGTDTQDKQAGSSPSNIESQVSAAPASTMLSQVIPHVVAGGVAAGLGWVGVIGVTVGETALLFTPAGPVIGLIAAMQFAGGVAVFGLGVSEAFIAFAATGGHHMLEPRGTESAIAIMSGPGPLMGAAVGATLGGDKGATIGIGAGMAAQSALSGKLTGLNVGNLIDVYSFEKFTRDSLDSSASGRSPLP